MSINLNSKNLLLFSLITFSILLINSCGSDDEMQPEPPLVGEETFRVTAYENILGNEVLETTTIQYDNENRVDYVVTKEGDQVIDSMDCVYNSSTFTTCTSYNPNNNIATRTLNIQFDGTGRMTSKTTNIFDSTPSLTRTETQVFDYNNNVLTDFLYQIDFEGDGIFDRTNDGHIYWDGVQIQSIVIHTFSNSIDFIDSTLFEYEGELIAVTRNLHSDNGGPFELTLQNTPMYENDLYTSAFVEEFFTDETGFTFPVSQANVDFYRYNENELLEKEFVGNNCFEYTYESGFGNIGDHYFSCIGEDTHLCILGVLPRVE